MTLNLYAVAFAKNSGLVIDDKAASFLPRVYTLEVLYYRTLNPI